MPRPTPGTDRRRHRDENRQATPRYRRHSTRRTPASRPRRSPATSPTQYLLHLDRGAPSRGELAPAIETRALRRPASYSSSPAFAPFGSEQWPALRAAFAAFLALLL